MLVRRFKVDGVELAYRLIDDAPSGITLVCAGGLGGTHLVWAGLIRALRDRYRIAIWDYPGLSDPITPDRLERIDVPLLARWFVSILDDLGAPQVVAVGWSLGVQVAMEVARCAAQRMAALVGICGLAGRPFLETGNEESVPSILGADRLVQGKLPRRAIESAVGWIAERSDRLELLRSTLRRIENPTRWLKRLGFVDPLVDDVVFDAVIRDYLAIHSKIYSAYLRASAEHDASELLASLPFPVLAVAGERDRFIRAKRIGRMAELIPNAEMLEVRGATHFAPLEYPDVIALKISDFLDRTLGPR